MYSGAAGRFVSSRISGGREPRTSSIVSETMARRSTATRLPRWLRLYDRICSTRPLARLAPVSTLSA